MTNHTATNPYPITNWDDAYENASHINNANDFIQRWETQSSAFRQQLVQEERAQLDLSYGSGERNKLDLFLPTTPPKGLVVFVHGGYWLRFDKSNWSHFAQGSLAAGYAVAIPSYTLCPQASIGEIVAEVASAIEFAAQKISGEIRLTGHSAGGHLVTRMLCDDSPLNKETQTRIVKTLSISGVHDLRPLLKTAMKDSLQIDLDQAIAQSPVLQIPGHFAPLTCWVGADERPEFIRLSKLQATIWQGFELATDWVEEPGKHHFDIIDGLMDQQHPLMRSLLA